MIQERRRFYAIMLSAVILPVILLSSFHHHEPVRDIDCIDCSHHIPHGHLNQWQGTDECLVCQFLTVSWLTSSESVMIRPTLPSHYLWEISVPALATGSVLSLSTRAPPSVIC